MSIFKCEVSLLIRIFVSPRLLLPTFGAREMTAAQIVGSCDFISVHKQVTAVEAIRIWHLLLDGALCHSPLCIWVCCRLKSDTFVCLCCLKSLSHPSPPCHKAPVDHYIHLHLPLKTLNENISCLAMNYYKMKAFCPGLGSKNFKATGNHLFSPNQLLITHFFSNPNFPRAHIFFKSAYLTNTCCFAAPSLLATAKICGADKPMYTMQM